MNKVTKEHLSAIAERLWAGQASLLVGAGFSKNAQRQTGAKLPPSWEELGDIFFEKSRNRKARKADRAYASILRLAEDVENVCGRPALIELIQRSLNDDQLFPSDVHMKLLALPWQDVYTTNYDTLLERCADKLKEQNKRYYTTIRNSQDIGMASSPFLMKLHGDIDTPSSIIITEDDYRKYSTSHQAMISHIQTTIMTKTLVLIGFSGNDPNFLQWLGWVRDALSNNQRKVYLFSVNAVSDASRKSLERKNVIVVDLKGVAGKGADSSANVAAAISYLVDFHQTREKERTEYRNKALKWGRTIHREESIDKTLELWNQERVSYPGWLIMPRDKREYWADTEGFYLHQEKLSQLGKGDDILYLDLFNWRIERCLYPIDNKWEDIYLSVLKEYKPSSRRCRSDIRKAWFNLKLGLLRLYRQEGWRDKWDNLREELISLKGSMEDEQRCRFEYEQALESVYKNDFRLLEDVLANWEEAHTDLYWDIRKGALWAEYLSFEKGKEITKKAFDGICSRLEQSTSEEERFYWASRKVHAHTVWNCMAQANFTDGHEETALARKTWWELRPYDDIWYEREFFESNLRPIEAVLEVKSKVASFTLGQSSTTTSMSCNSKDYRIAYAFFMYYEEAGFPIHLPFLNTMKKASLGKALSIMAHCSPRIADSWLLRSADPKLVPSVYNRRFLDRTAFCTTDTLYKRYLDCFSVLLQADKPENTSSWMLAFRNVLPEILARLCMKASYEARVRTLDCIDSVFCEKDSYRYQGMDNLLSLLISSFSREEKTRLIPRLAKMAIAKDRFGDCRFEPLYYIHDPSYLNVDLSDVIAELLCRLGKDEKEDKAILYRLLLLHKCNALSNEQQKDLAEKLWSKKDTSGFPVGTIFYRFAFLSFPHPNEIDPCLLLKEYFDKQSLPVVGKSSSVTFYGGHVPILKDLIGATNNAVSFAWDDSTLNGICGKIISMWDSDKERLVKDESYGFGFSVKEELQTRFDDVETVVTSLLAPRLQSLEELNRLGLARMVDEYEFFGMPSFRMRIALSKGVEEKVELKHEILSRLNSTDKRFVVDCINAIILLHHRGENIMQSVEWMSEYFRVNADHGRYSIISGLGILVANRCFIDNDSIRTNLIFGLDRLYEDTIIADTDNELTANEKMNLRLSVAPIVRALVTYYYGDLPHAIAVWRGYYNSKETCWDIRNAFADLVV